MEATYNPKSELNIGALVGRRGELTAMHRLLRTPGIKMLHVYGTGGTGKTALIQQYCHDHGGSDIFLLDLHEEDSAVIHKPRSEDDAPDIPFSSRPLPLGKVSDTLNSHASRCAKAIVVIDSFKEWMPQFEWFTSKLLPELAPTIRIVSASRVSLQQAWPLQAGEHGIHNLELKPLDQTASFQFIKAYGIHEFETLHRISKFSRGFPFALQCLSYDTVNEGANVVGQQRYRMQFYQKAVKYLLQDIKLTHIQSKILDAASVLWSFDYDLITHLLQREVAIHVFRKFCELPFVRLTPEGWQIDNSVRHWFRKEFSFRSPELHAAYQQKARSGILKRLHQRQPPERSELYLQLLHLIDRDILHMYCFLESFDDYEVRPLTKAELPTVRQMFITFHSYVPAFFPDLTLQENYLESYWSLSPDTFYGFYQKNQLAIFISALPLTPQIRKELIKNPTYRNYMKRSVFQENEKVMWIASFLPEFGASAVGLAFMYGYSRIAPHSLMTVITPFPEAHQLMESMGFQRIQWGDYVSSEGVEYKAYQLDLREGLLAERFLPNGAQAPPGKPSRLELIEHTKNLLIHFHHFEEHEEIVSACPHLQPYAHSKRDLDEAAKQVRKAILSIVDEWCNGKGVNVTYGSIIRMFYFQKSGNHEAVALRLNLSISTYYRNLKKAITKMSDLLAVVYHRE